MSAHLESELQRPFAAQMLREKARQILRKAPPEQRTFNDVLSCLQLRVLGRTPGYDETRGRPTTFLKVALESSVRDQLRAWQRPGLPMEIIRPDVANKGIDPLDLLPHDLLHRHRGVFEKTHTFVTERRLDLLSELARLSPEDRVMCELLMRLKPDEVAEELGLSRSTVYARLTRLRKTFEKRDLGQYRQC